MVDYIIFHQDTFKAIVVWSGIYSIFPNQKFLYLQSPFFQVHSDSSILGIIVGSSEKIITASISNPVNVDLLQTYLGVSLLDFTSFFFKECTLQIIHFARSSLFFLLKCHFKHKLLG